MPAQLVIGHYDYLPSKTYNMVAQHHRAVLRSHIICRFRLYA